MSRVLRCALVSFLFVLFVAQCVYSFLRFLEFGTTETFTTLKVRRQHFPGISLCPVERAAKVWTLGAEEERKRKEKSLREEYELATDPEFIFYYSHEEQDSMFPHLTGENLSDWRTTITTDPVHHNLISCWTYEPDGNFSTGYDSALNLYIDGSKVYQLMVVIHPVGDALLLPTVIHGRNFFMLPSFADQSRSRLLMYRVEVKRKKALKHEKLPCLKDEEKDEGNVHKCLENFVEKRAGCRLPWREDKEEEEICEDLSSLREYKRAHDSYKDSSEQEEYSAKLIMEEIEDEKMDPDESQSRFNQVLVFSLSSSGMPSEEEIYVFDIHDLIGNVGGCLGLFLGASLLSLYDDLKTFLVWCWFVLNKRNVPTVK